MALPAVPRNSIYVKDLLPSLLVSGLNQIPSQLMRWSLVERTRTLPAPAIAASQTCDFTFGEVAIPAAS